MRRSTSIFFLICCSAGAMAGPATHADVPVVNCAKDSSMQFADAVPGRHDRIRAPAALAPKLAYYKSGLLGILGPRDWVCDSEENSGGFMLYVQPSAPKTPSSKDDTERGLIQFLHVMGDSNFSQHLEIALVAARFFPRHRAYVRRVIAENHEHGGDTSFGIPLGPTPAMRITHRSATRVEYVIAPGKASEDDWLFAGVDMSKSSFPIYGVAYLAPDESSAEVVAVSLPDDLKALIPSIIASAGFAR